MKETFESTFGFPSEAGEILFNKLEDTERIRTFRMLHNFRRELAQTNSLLVAVLLRGHFVEVNNRHVGEYRTFKNNVISAMYRIRIRQIKKLDVNI